MNTPTDQAQSPRNRLPKSLFAALAVAGMSILLGGCSSPRPHFYTLTRSIPQTTQSSGKPDFLIEVQPVDIPPAVNRPQLLVRTSPQEVTPMEMRRWSAPLADEIRAALSNNLSTDLDTHDIYQTAAQADVPVYRIQVDIQRFESIVNHFAYLQATWTVRPPQKKSTPVTCASRIQIDSKNGYDGLIASHQKALTQLATAVAGVIQSLRSKDTPAHCPTTS